MKKATTKYFRNFYKARDDSFNSEKIEVTELFPRMVQTKDLELIMKPVLANEIKNVLKLFQRDKSPGLDGWTVEFFSYFFDLVSVDLVQMVEESRLYGNIPGCLNSTFLALIPKENNPTTFGDYRLISLCNLCYKLISKIISNRIKPIMSRKMLEEQLGILEGRRIQDAIGTSFECLHSIAKKKKNKSLIPKLDLRKAYDCVDWDFLHLILDQVGFDSQIIRWIMSCVTSPSYVVLLNGEVTDFF